MYIYIYTHIYIYIYTHIYFRARGREGEREKHQCVVASHMASTGDIAHNPGMCPDWESNQRHFGSQLVLKPLSYTSQDFFFFFLKHFTESIGLRLCFY